MNLMDRSNFGGTRLGHSLRLVVCLKNHLVSLYVIGEGGLSFTKEKMDCSKSEGDNQMCTTARLCVPLALLRQLLVAAAPRPHMAMPQYNATTLVGHVFS